MFPPLVVTGGTSSSMCDGVIALKTRWSAQYRCVMLHRLQHRSKVLKIVTPAKLLSKMTFQIKPKVLEKSKMTCFSNTHAFTRFTICIAEKYSSKMAFGGVEFWDNCQNGYKSVLIILLQVLANPCQCHY